MGDDLFVKQLKIVINLCLGSELVVDRNQIDTKTSNKSTLNRDEFMGNPW